HNEEPQPGIPEALPDDEHLLWQGGVSFRSLLSGSFHVRKLALYFAAALLVQYVLKTRQGVPVADALASTAGFLVLSIFALLILAAYAWFVSRATLYTLTSKRVVVRTGVALPVTVNLPYQRIQGADLRLQKDGSGDIALLPERGSRVSYLLLWPMVKPARLFRVRPVLRGVADAEDVARQLAARLAEAAPASEPEPRSREAAAASSNEKPGWRPYPAVPLAAMVSLVVIALAGVGWNVVTDDTRASTAAAYEAKIELYFEDREDGSVVVREALGGTVIDTLEPGTNGFVRATLRTFVRARKAVGAGAEEPFAIARTAAGRILLIDPVSQREVDLRAFGPTNSEAFGRYLSKDQRAELQPDETGVDAETQVALKHEESMP
ncbi:MAG: photosynthetic complex putative assembly protein PuhB, partial [Pseudomonadota bacterium]